MGLYEALCALGQRRWYLAAAQWNKNQPEFGIKGTTDMPNADVRVDGTVVSKPEVAPMGEPDRELHMEKQTATPRAPTRP